MTKGKLLLMIVVLGMIVINIIPTGSSQVLTSERILNIRLDHILHYMIWLGFAWLWVFSRICDIRFFQRHELFKYAALLFLTPLLCEYLQKMVPYRSFNPVDLIYNFLGAGLAFIFILLSKAQEKRY